MQMCVFVNSAERQILAWRIRPVTFPNGPARYSLEFKDLLQG